jgi:hypothetical protein
MNTKSKEFQALRSKWYNKLKRAGFVDAETPSGSLKEFHSTKFTKKRGAEETRRYYELAGHLLSSYPFPDEVSKTIWRYHAAGMVSTEIARRTKVSLAVVEKLINDLQGHFVGV